MVLPPVTVPVVDPYVGSTAYTVSPSAAGDRLLALHRPQRRRAAGLGLLLGAGHGQQIGLGLRLDGAGAQAAARHRR